MSIRNRLMRLLKSPQTVVPLIVTLGLIALALWKYDTLHMLLVDHDELERLVVELGWLGPVALIGINIAQIIVAPVPGYGVYIVAGFLFGAWMGGVWGTLGLLLGGMIAMGIGRIFGRPLAQAIIGAKQLDRFESATFSDNTLVWAVILLSPIGDAPFIMAGLARVSFKKIFVLTVITRVPAAFLAAAIGAGAVALTWTQLSMLILVLLIPLLIVNHYLENITTWFERLAQRFA